MDFIQLKIVNFLKKNIEIFLLIFLLVITTFITQLYNLNNQKVQRDYLEILRNSYFKKSVNYFFSNLKPKFEDIEYKIKAGDTIVNILNELEVNKHEVQKIAKVLEKAKAQNLTQNQTIKLTLENTNKLKEVSNILIPVSKSRKLEILKDLENNTFIKREIITNLEKKIILREGIIKSSLYKSATQENINPLITQKKDLENLENNLILVFAGVRENSKTANEIAKTFVNKLTTEKKKNILEIIQHTKVAKKLLKSKDFDAFGELLNETWKLKKDLSSSVSNSKINEIYDYGIKCGAIGGKLLGAGGSGFFLFYVPKINKNFFNKKFKSFIKVPFKFEKKGTRIIFNDKIN